MIKLSDFFMEANEDNVQYYCHHSKTLKQTQRSKALHFIRCNCIQYIKNVPESLRKLFPDAKNVFVCLPLDTTSECESDGLVFQKKPFTKNYNTRTYFIYKKGDTFECNCQGWQSKLKKGEIVAQGANCSHVLALYYAFRLKRFGSHVTE